MATIPEEIKMMIEDECEQHYEQNGENYSHDSCFRDGANFGFNLNLEQFAIMQGRLTRALKSLEGIERVERKNNSPIKNPLRRITIM